jgi:hypothetical protein
VIDGPFEVADVLATAVERQIKSWRRKKKEESENPGWVDPARDWWQPRGVGVR